MELLEVSRRWGTAEFPICREGRRNAFISASNCFLRRRSVFWTNRWPALTRASPTNLWNCSGRSATRATPFSSPRIRSNKSSCATGSFLCRAGNWCSPALPKICAGTSAPLRWPTSTKRRGRCRWKTRGRRDLKGRNSVSATRERSGNNGYDEAVRLYKPKVSRFPADAAPYGPLHHHARPRLRTLWLVLLQAPLIAVLLAIVFKPDSNFLPLSFYFCISISVIWMGGMNSVREIAREWDLVEREFRVGLPKLRTVCQRYWCSASWGRGPGAVFRSVPARHFCRVWIERK